MPQTEHGLEERVGAAVVAACEALTFEELAQQAFGELARGVDAAGWMASCGAKVQGDLAGMVPEYERAYRADDLNHLAKARSRDSVMINSHHVERRALHASGAYHDFFRRYDLEHFMTVRVSRQASEAMLILARGRSQPDFTPADAAAVAAAVPAVAIAVARCVRNDRRQLDPSLLESMLQRSSRRAQLALDERGRLLYRSARATDLLGLTAGVPEALAGAARRLAAFTGVPGAAAPTFSLSLASESGPLEAELGVGRTAGGQRFIHVEIHDPESAGAAAVAAAARHGLTPAETRVFHLLGMGLGNEGIGRRLHVSVSTVRTHVHRILGKLAVTSRAQAALIARGVQNHPIG